MFAVGILHLTASRHFMQGCEWSNPAVLTAPVSARQQSKVARFLVEGGKDCWLVLRFSRYSIASISCLIVSLLLCSAWEYLVVWELPLPTILVRLRFDHHIR